MKLKRTLVISGLLLGLSFAFVGCSGGGGGGETIVPDTNKTTTVSTTSVSGTTGSNSTTSSAAASRALSISATTTSVAEGTATLTIDSNSNGSFEDSDDLKYSVAVVNGSFSFNDVSLGDLNNTKALLSVEKEGYAPYTKVLTLTKDNAVSVLAEIGKKPVLTEVIDLSSLSASARASSFVKFGVRESANGIESFSKLMSLSEFKAQADVNLSQEGTVSESLIPTGAFPSSVQTVTANLQSFDSSDPDDFTYFPGALSGHGKPGVSSSASDTGTEVALESAGFDMIKLTDQDGNQIDLQSVATSKLSAMAGTAVCNGMSWTRYLRSNEAAIIKNWGDDDKNLSNGYQVPIWSNDNSTGSWQYVGLADVYDLNGTRPYFKACVDKKWQGYLNCDSPLATSRPQQICISAQDQFGNAIGGMRVYGKKGGSYSSAYLSNYGTTKGTGSIEIRDGNLTGWAYQYSSALTGWSYIDIDPTIIVANTTNTDCDYDMNITVDNPYTSVVHVKAYALADTNYTTPLKKVGVRLYNREYANYYSKYAYTDENGTATFEVKPNVQYTVTYKAGEANVTADGSVVAPETSDNTRDVYVNIKDANKAPSVYVGVYNTYHLTDKTKTMKFSVSARDGNRDPLTFNGMTLDNTPLVEGQDYNVSYKRSYDGYYYINGILNLQSPTLSGITPSLAANTATGYYTLKASVTDTKVVSSDDTNFRVSANQAPAIGSVYLRTNNRTYYQTSRNIPDGNFTISVNVYDRDGDKFTKTIKVDNVAYSGSVTLSKGNHTIAISATDEYNNTSSKSFTIYTGNHAPVISSAGATSYFVSQGGKIKLYAYVNDAEYDALSVVAKDESNTSYALKKVYGNTYRSDDITMGAANKSFGIVANDGQDSSARVDINITLNQAPKITQGVAAANIFTGDSHTFTCSANDPEGTAIVYEWRIDNSLAKYRSYTGSLSKTFYSAGDYNVSCTAYDRDGNSATSSAIAHVTVNQAPEFTTKLSNVQLYKNTTKEFTCSATDPEGGAVSYLWILDGKIQTATGTTFSTTFTTLGTFSLSCTASDPQGKKVTSVAEIKVVENQAPDFNTSLSDVKLDINESHTFKCLATDPEGTTVTYAWSLDSTVLNGVTGTSYTTSFTAAGTHTLVCTASDADGKSAQSSAKITVQAPNKPPVVEAEKSITVDANKTTSGTITFSDPDGTATIKVLDATPQGFSINPNTGAFTYDASSYAMLAKGETRQVSVQLVVTDDKGATAMTYIMITVNGTYVTPVDNNTSATAFTDGMSMYSFWLDYNQIYAGKIYLNAGTLQGSLYVMDTKTGDFNATTLMNMDYTLVNNQWVNTSLSDTYTTPDNLVLTTSSGTQVKIASVIDLNGTSHKLSEGVRADGNFTYGDANVTFTQGAKAYMLALKYATEYKVSYTPKVQAQDTSGSWYETNTTYSSLISYMQGVGGPAGAYINNEYVGVTFQRDTSAGDKNIFFDYTLIDENNASVTSLSDGLKGNLVTVNHATMAQAVVGTWTVITLPNGELAIVATPKAGFEQYFPDTQKVLVAVVNTKVMIGGVQDATTDFVTNKEMLFNDAAYANILSAVKNYIMNPPLKGMAAILGGKTVYTSIYQNMGTLESWSFDANFTSGTMTEIVGGTAQDTFSVTSYDSTSFTVDNNITIEVVGSTPAYILVSINKAPAQRVYFDEQSARDYFLGIPMTFNAEGLALKNSVTALMSPSATADVSHAKYLFTQLREASTSFIDLNNIETNTSTIVGTQAQALSTQIVPAANAIAADLNTTAAALQVSVNTFVQSVNQNFATVIGTIQARIKAIDVMASQYDENQTWGPVTTPLFNDSIAHTYAKNGTTVTETFTLNNQTVSTSWEDTASGGVNSVTTNGAISFSGTGYSLNISSLSFNGTKADFNASGSLDGNNSARMNLNQLSASFDVNSSYTNSPLMFNNLAATFNGDITSDGRTLKGKMIISESATQHNQLIGSYTGTTGEPTFNGTITAAVSLVDLKTMLANADNIISDPYGSANALVMVTYDSGAKSFMTSYTYDDNLSAYILNTQNGQSITCTETGNTTNAVYTHTVSCAGGTVQPYYGKDKIITLTVNGVEQVVHNAFLSSYDKGNYTYVNIPEIYLQDGGYIHYDINSSKLVFSTGLEAVISNIAMKDAVTMEQMSFDFSADGNVTHGTKVVSGTIGVMSANFGKQAKVYAKNLNITDGTNSFSANELSLASSVNDFYLFAITDGYDMNSPNYSMIYHANMRSYSSFETYTQDYSNSYKEANALDIIHGFNANGLHLAITGSDSNVLSVDANVSYTKDFAANEDANFSGVYNYAGTKFTGIVKAAGNQMNKNSSSYVLGSVESNGFEPFKVQAAAVTAPGSIEGYAMFTRSNTYNIGVSLTTQNSATQRTFNLADSNGVLATYVDSDTNTSAVSINFTNSAGTNLATFGPSTTGNSWEVLYSDGTSETLY